MVPDCMRLRGEDLDWREAEGEILVLDRRASRYFGVSASGALLWPLLAGGTSVEALAARLSRHYGIDQDRARSDVMEFLQWLRDRDLLGP